MICLQLKIAKKKLFLMVDDEVVVILNTAI